MSAYDPNMNRNDDYFIRVNFTNYILTLILFCLSNADWN